MISVRPLIEKGKQSFQIKDYEDAYRLFNEAYFILPRSVEYGEPEVEKEILLWIGVTEIKLGMLEKAFKTLSSLASKVNYSDPEVLYYYSLLLYYYSFLIPSEKGTYLNSALNLLQTAKSLSKDDPKVVALMAMVYSELGQLRVAESLLNSYTNYSLNPVIYLAYAHVYRLEGLYRDALTNINKVLRDDKNNADAIIEYALIMSELKDYKEALNALDNLLFQEKNNILAILTKAKVLEKEGKYIEAKNLLSKLDGVLSQVVITQVIQSPNLPPKQQSYTLPSRQTSYYSPSKPLSKLSLLTWDPKIWVGKRFSIYKIEELIGEGATGYVFRAVAVGGEVVAIKVLKVSPNQPDEQFNSLVNEAHNLVMLSNSPHTVKIYAIHVDKLALREIVKGNLKSYELNPPRIIMELMEGGNLASLLSEDKFYYSSKWKVAVYKAIRDVADALYHMHRSGFVHMDVKPQNIFLPNKLSYPEELDRVVFKLGDLGSAVRSLSSIAQLTTAYAPPEVYISTARPYMDIFSLGMTMYMLLNRKVDRPDINEMEEAFDCYVRGDMYCVQQKVNKSRTLLSQWDPNVPSEVRPILKAMINPDPIKRPTSQEVYSYFSRCL